MSSLLILGAGGHGRVVADAAREGGCWERIAFLDDRFPSLRQSGLWPVVGPFAAAELLLRDFPAVAVAVGDAPLRLALLERLAAAGFLLPAIVHPRASVSDGAVVGAGTVVLAQAAINFGAELGVGCIVNTGAGVDHDCRLAAGVHICPGAHLGGEVAVGRGSWIGIGASVIQCRSIGAGVTVGAGAAVVRDLPDGVTAVGVPARPM